MKTTHDLLGRPLTATELEVLSIYQNLKTLVANDQNSPCVQANARAALAAMWQVVNDLGLVYETLDDLGV